MRAPGGSPFKPFHSDGVLYSGQPVALVLAKRLRRRASRRRSVRVVLTRRRCSPSATGLKPGSA